MKNLPVLIFLLLPILPTQAQNYIGSWFGFMSGGTARFDISKDSLRGGVIVSSRRRDEIMERSAKKMVGTFALKDRTLLVFDDSDGKKKFVAMILCHVRDKVSFEIAANGVRGADTIDELVALNKRDTAKLFGNLLFHKDYLPVLYKMKDVNGMTRDEFIAFLHSLAEMRRRFANWEASMPSTFTNQMITRTLVDLHYNPVNGLNAIELHTEKYTNDKEVAELFGRL